MVGIYEKLSEERKSEQKKGNYPDWFTTGSYQMFKDKYKFVGADEGYTQQVTHIAKDLAKHAPSFLDKDHALYETITKHHGSTWEECFASIFEKGDIAPSSPLLANGGTDRGCTVSCSGSYVDNSVHGFYEGYKETALLTKEGFGTSAYLGDIQGRGSKTKKGFSATGSLPVLKSFQQCAKDISQGSVRRGGWAGYLPIDHPDFDEWADELHKNPQGQNIGWVVSKEVIQKWEEGDEELHRRRAKALWVKMLTGKGYFWKVDHVNEQQPQMYKDLGLSNKASNLCTEIVLHSDTENTYTCVLSSANCLRFDCWKDTGSIFIATVMLDCNAQAFIERAKNLLGLEKAIRFTEKSRALGLGLLGFHSYLQANLIAIEDLEAHFKNMEIFEHLDKESLAASQWMAQAWGEPEWCKGYGVRNTHRMAVAPNMSSATICGQVSQGIEPWLANVFVQATSAGEMQRINPQLLALAAKKGRDGLSRKEIRSIIDNAGSVQHLHWLDEKEKLVFKTAFEINQSVLLRLASTRQQYIDQGQSLNLFFSADEDEEYIAEIHKQFFLDDRLKGLYYIRSQAGVQASKDECVACEG